MAWQKLSFNLPSVLVDSFSDLIHGAGAVAITLEAHSPEALFEPLPNTTPLWACTTIHALFEDEIDLSVLISQLKIAVFPEAFHYQTEMVIDQDWQKNCRDAFKPICFSDRLWICPSWSPLPQDGKPCVLLDPGLAFGTGAHPTTQLCLNWLTSHTQGDEVVIDYGCGSGILALAALKLGAKKVWAVDNDPQALEAMLENAQRNQTLTPNPIDIPSRHPLSAVLPEQLPIDHVRANILIANILANPLISLAPHFAKLVSPGGKIALSGILAEQIAQVEKAYQPWFEFSAPVYQEEWVLLTGNLIKIVI